MADQATEPPRLPLVEAAAKLGKSTEAIRSLVRRGRLKAIRGNSGTLLVEVPPDAVRSDDRSGTGDDATALADALLEADYWREQAHRAEVAQTRAEAERDKALEVAEAKVAAAERVTEELRTLLAEVRQPWWRRWMG